MFLNLPQAGLTFLYFFTGADPQPSLCDSSFLLPSPSLFLCLSLLVSFYSVTVLLSPLIVQEKKS